MTEQAQQAFARARNEQLQQLHAHRIMTKVEQAAESDAAAARWPFELLQNACDAGPRPGASMVRVWIDWKPSQTVENGREIRFEHNGAPFSFDELAALLSGGSSKEFESDETTGRFGTGFLVTHVLSTVTDISGLFVVDGPTRSHERFDLRLERGGNKAEILENIRASSAAVKAAVPVDDIDEEPSARFVYHSPVTEHVDLGLSALERALPYLFSTCSVMHALTIRLATNVVETWSVEKEEQHQLEDGNCLTERWLLVTSERRPARSLRTLRFSRTAKTPESALVVLTLDSDGEWQVELPHPTVGRIFKTFPLANTANLPFDVILDGRFEVKQERESALFGKSGTQQRIIASMAQMRTAVAHCAARGCKDAHLLAKVAPLPQGIDTETNPTWWTGQLQELARDLARLPLVATDSGPCIPPLNAEDRFVVFPMAALSKEAPTDELDFKRFWSLVSAVDGLTVPKFAIAKEWTDIAVGWGGLKTHVEFATVGSLAAHIRKCADAVGEIPVELPWVWLRDFVGIVGTGWKAQQAVNSELLNGLLPNQREELRSPSDLIRDDGIDSELKPVAGELGVDCDRYLLSRDLADETPKALPPGLEYALERCVRNTEDTSQLMERCKKAVQDSFDDKHLTEVESGSVDSLMRFVRWLGTSRQAEGRGVARELPFLTCDGTFSRWSKTKVPMGPVSAWHPDAQVHSAAYPAGRVLHEKYADVGEEGLETLAEWQVIHPDPLVTTKPRELNARKLRTLLRDRDIELDDAVLVKTDPMSAIALLDTAILPSCNQRPDNARALLGSILNYAARHDPNWRSWRRVTTANDNPSLEFEIREAAWVSDLLHRAWVPVESEEPGKFAPTHAVPGNLEPLFNKEWLEDNEDAIQFLTECFGFDTLDLRLMAVALSGADTSRTVRDRLAAIVEASKGDVGILAELESAARRRKAQQRDVNDWKAFGLAVQKAIRMALQQRGLNVEVVDRGFDFKVSADSDEILEIGDLALPFGVGSWLVEVKATTANEVRLTPAQARTAATEADRYAVCAVPMDAIGDAELPESDLIERARSQARFVTDVGDAARTTTGLVGEATAERLGLRGESGLRYALKEGDWRDGLDLEGWVDLAFAK